MANSFARENLLHFAGRPAETGCSHGKADRAPDFRPRAVLQAHARGARNSKRQKAPAENDNRNKETNKQTRASRRQQRRNRRTSVHRSHTGWTVVVRPPRRTSAGDSAETVDKRPLESTARGRLASAFALLASTDGGRGANGLSRCPSRRRPLPTSWRAAVAPSTGALCTAPSRAGSGA